MILINVSLLSPIIHRVALLYDVHIGPEASHNNGTFFSRTQTCCLNVKALEEKRFSQ